MAYQRLLRGDGEAWGLAASGVAPGVWPFFMQDGMTSSSFTGADGGWDGSDGLALTGTGTDEMSAGTSSKDRRRVRAGHKPTVDREPLRRAVHQDTLATCLGRTVTASSTLRPVGRGGVGPLGLRRVSGTSALGTPSTPSGGQRTSSGGRGGVSCGGDRRGLASLRA